MYDYYDIESGTPIYGVQDIGLLPSWVVSVQKNAPRSMVPSPGFLWFKRPLKWVLVNITAFIDTLKPASVKDAVRRNPSYVNQFIHKALKESGL
jgi:hypothetical protein